MDALRVPGLDHELSDQAQSVAAFTAALGAAETVDRPRRGPVKSRRSRFALSLALSGAALVATSGLAYAGALPGAAQDTANGVLAGLGVTVPGPNQHAGTHPDTRGNSAAAPGHAATDDTGTDAPATPALARAREPPSRPWRGPRPRPAVTRARSSQPPPAAGRATPGILPAGPAATTRRVPPIRAEPVRPTAPAVDMTARDHRRHKPPATATAAQVPATPAATRPLTSQNAPIPGRARGRAGDGPGSDLRGGASAGHLNGVILPPTAQDVAGSRVLSHTGHLSGRSQGSWPPTTHPSS